MTHFQKVLFGCTAVFFLAFLASVNVQAQSTDFTGTANLATSVNGLAPADVASSINGTIGEFQEVAPDVRQAVLESADLVNVAFRGDTDPDITQSYVELRSVSVTPWPVRVYIYHRLRLCCWNGLNLCCTNYLLVCFRSIDIYNQNDLFASPTTLALEADASFDGNGSVYTIFANGNSTITIDPIQ